MMGNTIANTYSMLNGVVDGDASALAQLSAGGAGAEPGTLTAIGACFSMQNQRNLNIGIITT